MVSVTSPQVSTIMFRIKLLESETNLRLSLCKLVDKAESRGYNSSSELARVNEPKYIDFLCKK